VGAIHGQSSVANHVQLVAHGIYDLGELVEKGPLYPPLCEAVIPLRDEKVAPGVGAGCRAIERLQFLLLRHEGFEIGLLALSLHTYIPPQFHGEQSCSDGVHE